MKRQLFLTEQGYRYYIDERAARAPNPAARPSALR